MLMVRNAFRRGALWLLCGCMGWTAVEAAPANDRLVRTTCVCLRAALR